MGRVLGLARLSAVRRAGRAGDRWGRASATRGTGFQDAGATIERALSQIPLVGEGAGNIIGDAFDGIGTPLVDAGADLERLLLIIAAVLGLLLVAVFVIPWLNRYLPWRRRRWRELNAGDRAIRRSPARQESRVDAADMQRVLATRAMYRLEYSELLDQTSDPIGDFVEGRYDRLAKAEMESVGLTERGKSGG